MNYEPDEDDAQNDNLSENNVEQKRNLHENQNEPIIGLSLHGLDIIPDMSDVILDNQNDVQKISYRFNELVKDSKLIYNKMNMYCISTTVDTVRKMEVKQWDAVRDMYEKLKVKEITHDELNVLVCKILEDIYGETEVMKILNQYDKNIDKAVLIFGKYVFSRYNEAFIDGIRLYNGMKSFVRDNSNKYLLSHKKPSLNKEKMNVDDKIFERKKKTPVTKRKCYACSENRKKLMENKTKQIIPNSPTLCTPATRKVSYIKTNLVGLKTQVQEIKTSQTPNLHKTESLIKNKLNKNYQINRNKFDKTMNPSYSEGDINLNDDKLITDENSEEVIIKAASCSEITSKRSEDILTTLMKSKGSDKKTRSNLTIRLEKEFLPQEPIYECQIGSIQRHFAIAVTKLKR